MIDISSDQQSVNDTLNTATVNNPQLLLGLVEPPLIPALRRQRQGRICEFMSSLVYIGSFRTARALDPVSKKEQ